MPQTIALSEIKKDPRRRFLVITDESYDDTGLASGGTRRGLVAIDPARVPMNKDDEQTFIDNIKAKKDFIISDKETNTPGWFEVFVVDKGETTPSAGTEHDEAKEVVDAATETEQKA